MKKAAVPGRRRGLPPIVHDLREEEEACICVEPNGPVILGTSGREEESLSVPTCAPREEERSDVFEPVKGKSMPVPEFEGGEPQGGGGSSPPQSNPREEEGVET
ncbi:MAG: hypothetical protein EA339_09270 [Rhodobacteraceae bacterium]|nr:MAG: hypothetical protein EA339_09270 [Paracoccaceae bacterium]